MTTTPTSTPTQPGHLAKPVPPRDTPRSIPLPQFDHQPRPYDGPSRDETIALRRQYLSPGLITYYAEPLMVVEGKMQYVWDEMGKRYLDAFAGIVTVSVGHCHPRRRRKGPPAERDAPAHHHHLPPPDHRPLRRKAREQDAHHARRHPA